MKNPIHVYWHNRTDNPGHENELSYIQRKMAYGYNILSKGKNEVEVKLLPVKIEDRYQFIEDINPRGVKMFINKFDLTL